MKYKLMQELSWTARKRGATYCAPACGGGCTVAAHRVAKAAAANLCASLGDDWQPRVWENLGWHYSAISPCGRWKIHPFIYGGKIDSYTAFLGDAGSSGGRWAESGKTPRAAMRATWKAIEAERGRRHRHRHRGPPKRLHRPTAARSRARGRRHRSEENERLLIMPVKRKPTKPAPSIPKHARADIHDTLDSVREMCDDDEALTLIALTDEDHKKIGRVIDKFGDEISWSLGYLRAVEDILKIKPAKLLKMLPLREESEEDDDSDDDDDSDEAGSDDDSDDDDDEEFEQD